MGHGKVVVAGVQLAGVKKQKQHNIATTVELIRQASSHGAQVVVTPEVVLSGFVGGAEERQLAEAIPGPSTDVFAALAAELGIYVLLGLSESRDGQVYNAMAVLSPRGDVMGVMRKVHINKYEVDGLWRNGSEFPVWDFRTPTGEFRGGIMICYDREVPESARLLMLQGVEVVFNPLACNCPVDEIHRCLLRTRAFENECYVLVVNHADPRQNGHSMFIRYDGQIVSELDEANGVLLAEADLDALSSHRATGIYGKHHRRPELYGPLTDPAGQIHPSGANLPPRS